MIVLLLVVRRRPRARIIERRDGCGETVAEEEPAPTDASGGELAAAGEVVDRGARNAEEIRDLAGGQHVGPRERGRVWRLGYDGLQERHLAGGRGSEVGRANARRQPRFLDESSCSLRQKGAPPSSCRHGDGGS